MRDAFIVTEDENFLDAVASHAKALGYNLLHIANGLQVSANADYAIFRRSDVILTDFEEAELLKYYNNPERLTCIHIHYDSIVIVNKIINCIAPLSRFLVDNDHGLMVEGSALAMVLDRQIDFDWSYLDNIGISIPS